jgi:hypothetical protein
MASSRTLLLWTCFSVVAFIASAWAPSVGRSPLSSHAFIKPSYLILNAAADGKKKRKRRRKQPPPGTVVLPTESNGSVAKDVDDSDDDDEDDDEIDDLLTIADVANYKFKTDEAIGKS